MVNTILEQQPFHIHIQARKDAPQVFQMTEDRWKAALSCHSDVADRIKFTIAVARTPLVTDWSEENRKEFKEAMATANVLVGYRFPKDDLATVAPNLAWIHIIGAGIEHLLPLDWLPRGVNLINNRGVHAPKTGEYAMLAILMLGAAIPRLVTAQRQKLWTQLFTSVVEGKTLVVVGVGEQGRSVAKHAKKLGLKVIGVDVNPLSQDCCDEMVTPEDLPRVLPKADFVGVTVPLTAKTRHMIGRNELGMMKKTAGLFNIARAQVVDYQAVAEKLEKGELGGAVLDVFDPEPLPPDSPLWSTPNLIITPHVGCDDLENYIPRTFDIVLNNVRRYFEGQPLVNVVNLDLGY
jgi:phosphoglycerate dehydrogenase-like enzyme